MDWLRAELAHVLRPVKRSTPPAIQAACDPLSGQKPPDEPVQTGGHRPGVRIEVVTALHT